MGASSGLHHVGPRDQTQVKLGSRHLGPAEPSNASSTLIFLTATSLKINTLYKSTIHFLKFTINGFWYIHKIVQPSNLRTFHNPLNTHLTSSHFRLSPFRFPAATVLRTVSGDLPIVHKNGNKHYKVVYLT